MNGHRAARLAGACLLLFCWAAPSASQETSSETFGIAPETMHQFLGAWLVDGDEVAAMRHFATTERSLKLAPRAVRRIARKADFSDPGQVQRLWNDSLRGEYWKVLGRLSGGETGHGLPLETILKPIDGDLADALKTVLHVPAIKKDPFPDAPFTIFVADSDDAIYAFDGGYGNVAAGLHPTENTVLGMIADFAARNDEYNGPFVSFWAEDELKGQWKIQALGAAPEAWRGGR